MVNFSYSSNVEIPMAFKIIPLIFIMLTIIAILALQVMLSKISGGKFGVVLPGIFTAISIVFVIARIIDLPNPQILDIIFTLMAMNIPTTILVLVYTICRRIIEMTKKS
jgi:hypothetical protein